MNTRSMILNKIKDYAETQGERTALAYPCGDYKVTLTYKELWEKALSLAAYLSEHTKNNNPIVVYGHKSPYMIVSFLGCVLSGHAYCPVDFTTPADRVMMILEQTKSSAVIAPDEFLSEIKNLFTRIKSMADLITPESVKQICSRSSSQNMQAGTNYGERLCPVSGDDTFYIIFTSGSTGTPKGVEISSDALDNFLKWSCTLGEEYPYTNESVFLNQAPFSFDLSVMDLYTCLYVGGMLCMMDKKVQSDIGAITPFIKENKVTAMVATPSFGNVCLADTAFNAENLPLLKTFFFCGEVLTNKTAERLIKRFPGAVIQNTYGPTESTVAVSNIRITRDVLNDFSPLPVGKAKPGTGFIIDSTKDVGKRIDGTNESDKISDKSAGENAGHEIGEILITGDTLAKGYFKKPELTDKAFVSYEKDGKSVRAYRTGDQGYLKDGRLFYIGRIDLQIKMGGYRIELGDIESSILKNETVAQCAVCPRYSRGKVRNLVAMIVLKEEAKHVVCDKSDIVKKRDMDVSDADKPEAKETGNSLDENRAVLSIEKGLKKLLPPYMLPQSYIFLDTLPMTANGKIDRKALSKLTEEN